MSARPTLISRIRRIPAVECLDRVLAVGETHFDCLVREYVVHHNTERPHQSLDNQPMPDPAAPEPPALPFPERGVVCEERLGGLLKHYRRAA